MKTLNVVEWSTFKDLVESKNLLIQYNYNGSKYEIVAPETGAILWCIELITGMHDTEIADFEANFKSTANKPLEYRSSDGLPKVASAKFVETLGFYLTGETPQADLSADSTKYIKYHFDDPYTLSGVTAFWKDSNFGDCLDFEVGVYTDEEDEGTFIQLSKFASEFKIMGTDHITIDVPTVKTIPSTVNLGSGDLNTYVRIKAVNVGSSASKVIVNLVGWM